MVGEKVRRRDPSCLPSANQVHEDDTAGRLEVVTAARAMLRDGLVVGMVGNISLRLGDRVLITPTRMPYDRMSPTDLSTLDLAARHLAGPSPSSELPLHLALYRQRPEVRSVVHTHSPYATAWSFLGEPLLPITEENRYYGIGVVHTYSAGQTSSEELARGVIEAQGNASAVLLGRHGVLTSGSSVAAALDIARVVERQAQIAWILRGARDPG